MPDVAAGKFGGVEPWERSVAWNRTEFVGYETQVSDVVFRRPKESRMPNSRRCRARGTRRNRINPGDNMNETRIRKWTIMRRMTRPSFRESVVRSLAFTVALFALGHVVGCSEMSGSSEKQNKQGRAEPKTHTMNQAKEYVSRWQPLLQEHGFPNVCFEPISDDEGVHILVHGHVVYDTKRSLQDSRIILKLLLEASHPPVKLVNEVEYVRQ